MPLAPRAVVVTRPTELDELVARHGTRQQAAFFLRSRSRSLEEVEGRHQALRSAVDAVAAAIPADWRRGQVVRSDLARFLFGPDDIVVVVGQDGLVANVAKYLDGQPVIGIDPEPGRNPGVLVRHGPGDTGALLAEIASPEAPRLVEARSLVGARTDDGQMLLALNEVYVGDPGHQSARYRLDLGGGTTERQSSSGLLVGTGTGATGWCRSAWLERRSPLALPAPTEETLCWFVREAWPSPSTDTGHTEGILGPGDELALVAESDRLVVFGDGIEGDAMPLTWGQRLTISLSARRLHLVV